VETTVAGAPLIVPTEMHVTLVRSVELSSGQWTNDKPGVRTRARSSLISRQQSQKNCIPSMTVIAEVHSASENNSPSNINPQSHKALYQRKTKVPLTLRRQAERTIVFSAPRESVSQ